MSGGAGNTASGDLASVSGGSRNEASGEEASVSGGSENTAADSWTTVAGGRDGEIPDDGLTDHASGNAYDSLIADTLFNDEQAGPSPRARQLWSLLRRPLREGAAQTARVGATGAATQKPVGVAHPKQDCRCENPAAFKNDGC